MSDEAQWQSARIRQTGRFVILTDRQGNQLIVDRQTRIAAATEKATGREATFPLDDDGKLWLPEGVASRDFRNSMAYANLADRDAVSQGLAMRGFTDAVGRVQLNTLGVSTMIREGDISEIISAWKEEGDRRFQQDQRREQPSEPAKPHTSIEQLGNQFRAEIPANVKAEVRTDGGEKDPAPAPTGLASMDLPASPRTGDLTTELAGFESALPSGRHAIVADTSPEPQPTHGLNSTVARHQASAETFRA